MQKYIGCKLVEAEPQKKDGKEGYAVKYQDGYTSWSPAEAFERAYLVVNDNQNLPSGVSIEPEMVDNFIDRVDTTTLGDRTTVVRCILVNGFEIVESSSCVDPRNYNERIGQKICMRKIKDKIWELLGFLLQTAWHGIKKED